MTRYSRNPSDGTYEVRLNADTEWEVLLTGFATLEEAEAAAKDELHHMMEAEQYEPD